MSIKAILVAAASTQDATPVLETAFLLAQEFESYIEGVPLRAPVAGTFSLDGPSAVEIETLERLDAESVRKTCAAFEAFMEARKVPRWQSPKQGLSFNWLNSTPSGYDFIGKYGRLFDVIVVPGRGEGGLTSRLSIVQQCLFQSGRPVLLAPPAAPNQIGQNILIAWNGSVEQARTTRFAIPLLQRAIRVTILTVDAGRLVVPSAEQIARSLQFHGIATEAVTIRAERRHTGEAILAFAKSAGSDLLIKGAYTESRLEQMIFGGATRKILEEAAIPVFMAH
jgi:nucleotide-binding universal stress UspA family protein